MIFLCNQFDLCFLNWKHTLSMLLMFFGSVSSANSQTLTLKAAVKTAMDNYGTIKARSNYLKASQASVKAASVDYLPNVSVGAQQAYGTVNGQTGPLIASGGLNAASSGPPFSV